MHTADCPLCTGLGEELGTLGSLIHYRCQSCGHTFNRVVVAVSDRTGFAVARPDADDAGCPDDDVPELEVWDLSGFDVRQPLHLDI